MDIKKQECIFAQYINQYESEIDKTLNSLRKNNVELLIPYAQFLFSIIDYYGIVYLAAKSREFKKRGSQNFKVFFSSEYFPEDDRCKAEFLYFIRNGIVHQIFAKGCSVGVSSSKKLFFKDSDNNDIPALNLTYLDSICEAARKSIIEDLKINEDYTENIYDVLIIKNYGFNDHQELEEVIFSTFDGDLERIFINCLEKED